MGCICVSLKILAEEIKQRVIITTFENAKRQESQT